MGLIYSGKLWMIQRFISGFSNNSFLVTCKRTNESIIIDTPDNPVDLLNSSKNFLIVGIFITHGHSDHLEGFKDVYDRYQVPVGIGNNDINSLPLRPKEYINVLNLSHCSITDKGFRYPMFKIQMRFDDQTEDVEVKMPYITLVKMMEIVTTRISPEDLSNEDSIGESVLKEFVFRLFTLNDDLLQEIHLQEAQSAIEEVENIIRKTREG